MKLSVRKHNIVFSRLPCKISEIEMKLWSSVSRDSFFKRRALAEKWVATFLSRFVRIRELSLESLVEHAFLFSLCQEFI